MQQILLLTDLAKWIISYDRCNFGQILSRWCIQNALCCSDVCHGIAHNFFRTLPESVKLHFLLRNEHTSNKLYAMACHAVLRQTTGWMCKQLTAARPSTLCPEAIAWPHQEPPTIAKCIFFSTPYKPCNCISLLKTENRLQSKHCGRAVSHVMQQ